MEKGFTLVEIIVVVALLVVIFLIAYPAIGTIVDKSRVQSNSIKVDKLVEIAKINYTENYSNTSRVYDVENGLFINGNKVNMNNEFNGIGKIFFDENGQTKYYIYIDGYCFYKKNTKTAKLKNNMDECKTLYEN